MNKTKITNNYTLFKQKKKKNKNEKSHANVLICNDVLLKDKLLTRGVGDAGAQH